MEAIMAEPTQEGQAPKTPVEVVAQVLPSSKYLQNVGLQRAGPNSVPTLHVYMNLKLKFSKRSKLLQHFKK